MASFRSCFSQKTKAPSRNADPEHHGVFQVMFFLRTKAPARNVDPEYHGFFSGHVFHRKQQPLLGALERRPQIPQLFPGPWSLVLVPGPWSLIPVPWSLVPGPLVSQVLPVKPLREAQPNESHPEQRSTSWAANPMQAFLESGLAAGV